VDEWCFFFFFFFFAPCVEEALADTLAVLSGLDEVGVGGRDPPAPMLDCAMSADDGAPVSLLTPAVLEATGAAVCDGVDASGIDEDDWESEDGWEPEDIWGPEEDDPEPLSPDDVDPTPDPASGDPAAPGSVEDTPASLDGPVDDVPLVPLKLASIAGVPGSEADNVPVVPASGEDSDVPPDMGPAKVASVDPDVELVLVGGDPIDPARLVLLSPGRGTVGVSGRLPVTGGVEVMPDKSVGGFCGVLPLLEEVPNAPLAIAMAITDPDCVHVVPGATLPMGIHAPLEHMDQVLSESHR